MLLYRVGKSIVFLNILEHVRFQQDGAPPHYEVEVWEYLLNRGVCILAGGFVVEILLG